MGRRREPTPARRAAPTPMEIGRAVALFKVLSHPDRLRIVCSLEDGRETTQKALREAFGWPQSTTARHLAVLRNAGLVAARREGAEVLLRLGNPLALRLFETVCAWVHEDPAPYGSTATPLTGVLLTARGEAATESHPIGHGSPKGGG